MDERDLTLQKRWNTPDEPRVDLETQASSSMVLPN